MVSRRISVKDQLFAVVLQFCSWSFYFGGGGYCGGLINTVFPDDDDDDDDDEDDEDNDNDDDDDGVGVGGGLMG